MIAEWGSVGSNCDSDDTETTSRLCLVECRHKSAILNVELCIHDDVEIDLQNAGGLRLFADLNGNPLASVLNPATAAVKLVVIDGAEVQPQGMFRGQKLVQGYVGQCEILRDRGHLGMSLRPDSEVLPGLVPWL